MVSLYDNVLQIKKLDDTRFILTQYLSYSGFKQFKYKIICFIVFSNLIYSLKAGVFISELFFLFLFVEIYFCNISQNITFSEYKNFRRFYILIRYFLNLLDFMFYYMMRLQKSIGLPERLPNTFNLNNFLNIIFWYNLISHWKRDGNIHVEKTALVWSRKLSNMTKRGEPLRRCCTLVRVM